MTDLELARAIIRAMDVWDNAPVGSEERRAVGKLVMENARALAVAYVTLENVCDGWVNRYRDLLARSSGAKPDD